MITADFEVSLRLVSRMGTSDSCAVEGVEAAEALSKNHQSAPETMPDDKRTIDS